MARLTNTEASRSENERRDIVSLPSLNAASRTCGTDGADGG